MNIIISLLVDGECTGKWLTEGISIAVVILYQVMLKRTSKYDVLLLTEI